MPTGRPWLEALSPFAQRICSAASSGTLGVVTGEGSAPGLLAKAVHDPRQVMRAGDSLIREGEITTGGDPVGNCHVGHPSCSGGLDAIDGILDHEARCGLQPQTLGGFEVKIGSGLDAWGVIPADSDIKVLQKADFMQPSVDPAMRGTRYYTYR